MYDVAALTSGYEIEDSGDFAGRILSMMTSKAKLDVKDAEVEARVVVHDVTAAQKEFFGIDNFENV